MARTLERTAPPRPPLPAHLSKHNAQTLLEQKNAPRANPPPRPQDDLRTLFATHGEVTDAFIPVDRETGRSRGFGFVTMDADAAQAAMAALDSTEFMGRALKVRANPNFAFAAVCSCFCFCCCFFVVLYTGAEGALKRAALRQQRGPVFFWAC